MNHVLLITEESLAALIYVYLISGLPFPAGERVQWECYRKCEKSEGKQWWFDLCYTREEQQFIFANLSKVKRGENKFCERISLDGGMKAFFSLMVFLGNLFFAALSIFHRALKYKLYINIF